MTEDIKELALIEEAKKLQLKINYIQYPFVEPTHPAFELLAKYMIKAAAKGDYSLIEETEQQVSDLVEQRLEVIRNLQAYREEREKEGNG